MRIIRHEKNLGIDEALRDVAATRSSLTGPKWPNTAASRRRGGLGQAAGVRAVRASQVNFVVSRTNRDPLSS
jgi:hypothetical protein